MSIEESTLPKHEGIRTTQAAQTRAALIASARELFAAQGFHATGTHEIVARAGVRRGALQHHFPRKEDLFRAVFEHVEEDMMVAAREPTSDALGAKWLRLKAALGAFLDAATKPEVQRIILIDGPAVLGWQEWRRLEAHYGLGHIEQAVIDGMASGHVRRQAPGPLATLILSMIDEAALIVANSSEPAKARSEVAVALATMLSSLE